MNLIEIKSDKLKEVGFLDSGVKRYMNTVTEYSDLLLEKSKKLGEAKKAKDSNIEINYENVQAAARMIAASFGTPEIPKWKLWTQVGEYLLTAICGYLGSQATQPNAPAYFTLLFVVAAVIGVSLFIVRKTSK